MDVVVTVPKPLWDGWLREGDLVDDAASGEEWGFFFSTRPAYNYAGGYPEIRPGERVYVVSHGRVRGYAPLTRLNGDPPALVRRGGAVAVTIPGSVVGFAGWRYRWWRREDERPFPSWRTEGVPGAAPGALFGPRS